MARDGAGNYDLPGADFTNGTLADATEMMTKLDDIASALTSSIAKDGQTTPTASLPMGGFNHTGVSVATSRSHYARASQIADGALTYGGVAGGTADALTLSPSPAITAYVIGQQFQFKVGAAANTGAATININGVGAGSVTWPDGTALAAGDLPANGMVEVKVQATTPVFHLVTNTRAGASVGSVTNAMLANMTGPAFKGRTTGTGAPQDTDARYVAAVALNNYMAIGGLTYSRNGSDASNDIDVATGGAIDGTGAYWMALDATITKRLDAAWAVGTNQGGLDTGAVGNSDYYIWLIARSDTNVVDVLFSLSATSPTMPTNYDYKRLIGWLKREGGANVDFKTYEMAGGGLDFKWTSPRLDVNIANTLTTSRRTDALSVPLNFSTVAQIRAVVFDASANPYVIICCPDEADAAPSGTAAPGSSISGVTSAVGSPVEIPVRTSATGTVASRATTATVDNFIIVTRGFEWARR